MPRWIGTIAQVEAIEKAVSELKNKVLDPFDSTLRHNGGNGGKLFPGEDAQSKVYTHVYEITPKDPNRMSATDLIAWVLSEPPVVRFSYNYVKDYARFDVNKLAWDKLTGCADKCNGKGVLPQIKGMVEGMERDWVNGG